MHKENHAFFFLSAISGSTAILTDDENRHAFRALRFVPGSAVYGTDGNGNIYKCMLTERTRASGEVDIVETVRLSPNFPPVHLHIGLPDRDQFEEALTGLSALGAATIIPVVCSYCQEPWWQQWEKRHERLRRKMIAAIKQAQNPWLPDVIRPQSFAETISMFDTQGAPGSVRIVADWHGAGLATVMQKVKQIEHVDCFIGPPGGFSPQELSQLFSINFNRIRLARYRLRTELASVVLCAQIMQHFIGETNAVEIPPLDLPNVK